MKKCGGVKFPLDRTKTLNTTEAHVCFYQQNVHIRSHIGTWQVTKCPGSSLRECPQEVSPLIPWPAAYPLNCPGSKRFTDISKYTIDTKITKVQWKKGTLGARDAPLVFLSVSVCGRRPKDLGIKLPLEL